MKKSIQPGKNKFQQWEEAKNYNQHLGRINKIRSRSDLRRAKKELSYNILDHSKKSAEKQYLIQIKKQEKMRHVQEENYRLMKKLDEISKRKNQFTKNNQTKAEKQYYTINIKSRQANRRKREQMLQQQNDEMVQRIIRMRSKGLSINSSFESLPHSPKKSRSKLRSNSLLLPKLSPKNSGTPLIH